MGRDNDQSLFPHLERTLDSWSMKRAPSGDRQSSEGIPENETRTSFQEVLIPPVGDLQLPRNIMERGDRMGTSSFGIVKLPDQAGAFRSVAPVHHWIYGHAAIQRDCGFSGCSPHGSSVFMARI